MDINEVKKKLDISNKDIANYFGYKNVVSYQNSNKKKIVEQGIVKIYEKAVDALKKAIE